MMGEGNTCDVCGGSETNLVDGFYYCAECGTQDTNVRETVVEHTALADGTFARFAKAKYSVKIQDGVQMSAEWYKWHAYNFVLAGLTERMLMLGAEPSFKMKVLWIWAKYIKKHQNREKMGSIEAASGIEDKTTTQIKENNNEDSEDEKPPPMMTIKILLGILYLALNLDRSAIQLSHVRRYMNDGRLHIHRSWEYVPKEIDNTLPELRGLSCSSRITLSPTALPNLLKKFEDLDLGPSLVPDLETMTDNLLKELCLPTDMKNLVLSLMDFVPVNFLNKTMKSTVLHDCECVVMAYILVALKMCFGLDDDYEIRLSDTVDEINYQENNLKAYKTDLYLEPSERLFSFREWSKYLLLRKQMLCKHYLPIAKECNLFLDDYVYIEHSKRKAKKEVKLSDEVTMDIINKIPENNDLNVIPLSEFEASATPISSHTDVISRHLRDLDTRQLLSEDFTQYSIDYASQDLSLRSCSEEISENIVIGVNKTGKINNDLIGLHFIRSYSDSTIVYVKNCENRNWIKTKRPMAEHIVKEDSDHGYDSNIDNSPSKSNTNTTVIEEAVQDSENTCNFSPEEDIEDKKLEVFDEEEESKNIFDDDFLDIDTEDTKLDDTIQKFGNDFSETMETLRYEDSYENNEFEDSKIDIQHQSLIDNEIDTDREHTTNSETSTKEKTFNPETFNREEVIKELIIAACSEYKVPVPQNFRPKQPKEKRKGGPDVETDATRPKRVKLDEESKRARMEKRDQINEIMSAYYRGLQEDILCEISQQVKSIIEQNAPIDQNSSIENDNNGTTERNNPVDAVIENGNDTVEETNLELNSDQDGAEGSGNNGKNEVDGDKSDNESIVDPVYKGEVKFDEKTYDAKQLYLKVKGGIEQCDLQDLDNDEEINALIEEKIQQSKKPITEIVDSDFDSSDDLPLSHFTKRKDRKNYENLIKNSEELEKFNYWFKHYLGHFFNQGVISAAKRFDTDFRESFPKSFIFVLCECAFVLNCSTYVLYKHLTDIEKEILRKVGYKKKVPSFKGTGLVLDRRDRAAKYDRWKKRMESSQGQ